MTVPASSSTPATTDSTANAGLTFRPSTVGRFWWPTKSLPWVLTKPQTPNTSTYRPIRAASTRYSGGGGGHADQGGDREWLVAGGYPGQGDRHRGRRGGDQGVRGRVGAGPGGAAAAFQRTADSAAGQADGERVGDAVGAEPAVDEGQD